MVGSSRTWSQSPSLEFTATPPFDEQIAWVRPATGIRVAIVAAPNRVSATQRWLLVYAVPNGNTIEQTLGCAAEQGRDFHFDIQHVAAQVRRLREVDREHDVVLAVVEASGLSWPAYRRDHAGADKTIRKLVASLGHQVAADRLVLAGHSGGGSFLFGYMNASEELPAILERVVFLDANYSYTDQERHGDKLLRWLRGAPERHLVVIAYDDREIVFQGKKVVGPAGGTFRASRRMLRRFRQELKFQEHNVGSFRNATGLDGRIRFIIHTNPENKILHTALVGEMNGLLHGLTLGTELEGDWGTFGGPRAYANWIQATPFVEPQLEKPAIPTDASRARLVIPARPAHALTGSQFRQRIETMSLGEREAEIARQLASGNCPEFLRDLKPIRVTARDPRGTPHVATYFVMPDYLSVGTDDDFFRIPMTPSTALSLADQFDAMLITTKVSDDCFAAAETRLEPQPLTVDRETVATFYRHHQAIEDQIRGKPRGRLIVGIKKDIVLSNRLKEREHRVAIYGWHHLDGSPIQPLYVGHVDRYVDYSHGVRLMARTIMLDGREQSVTGVLRDPELCHLLSTEGPLDPDEIRRSAGWSK
ncbi:MAG TPA: hypothetical protein VIY86_06250 [Pirellulaceae bacterium]